MTLAELFKVIDKSQNIELYRLYSHFVYVFDGTPENVPPKLKDAIVVGIETAQCNSEKKDVIYIEIAVPYGNDGNDVIDDFEDKIMKEW